MKAAQPAPVSPGQIDAVRRFNRFHTRLVGALNEHLLASDFSLPQARVLYELAHAEPDRAPSARELGETLRMDAGYLSRLLAGLEAEGLLQRTPTPGAPRRQGITLTTRGMQAFSALNNASAAEVAELLAPLAPAQREALVGAMRRIQGLLGDAQESPAYVLREPRPGDMGWVVHKHGELYAREYGWDWTFEALVAGIVAKFVDEFVPGKERCWIAERDGESVGSVFVVRQDDETAKLRMLYVDPSARGMGLGRRLVDECLAFARQAGYRRMVLWTNDVLVSARRIYQAAGFTLQEEERHHSFGKDLVAQVWARDL